MAPKSIKNGSKIDKKSKIGFWTLSCSFLWPPGPQNGTLPGSHFRSKIEKMTSKKPSKNRCRKSEENWCQKGWKRVILGVVFHQKSRTKSMRKSMPKKSWKSWKVNAQIKLCFLDFSRDAFTKKHIFWKRWNHGNHCIPRVEYVSARLRPKRRTSKKWGKSQRKSYKKRSRKSNGQLWKIIEKAIENGAKYHDISIQKSMLEKGMQKVWKMMPKWSQKGAKIH